MNSNVMAVQRISNFNIIIIIIIIASVYLYLTSDLYLPVILTVI